MHTVFFFQRMASRGNQSLYLKVDWISVLFMVHEV